jgi:hypothetical protein
MNNGLLLGLLLARVLSSFLYGVQAWDPTIYLAVPVPLALITLFATIVALSKPPSTPSSPTATTKTWRDSCRNRLSRGPSSFF